MTADDVGPELSPSRTALARLSEFYGVTETFELMDVITVRDYWLDTWKKRIKEKWDVKIVFTGESGIGKSAGALQIAQALDPTFNEKTITEHVAYTAEECINLLDRRSAGEVVVYDESVVGLLATDTFALDQKLLVKMLNIVRAKGIVLIICIPNLQDVAKAFRARSAKYWIAAVQRGIAYVHTRNEGIVYKANERTYGFSIDRQHNPFTWDNIDETPLWKAYYAIKMERIHKYAEEAKREIAAQKAKRQGGHR